MNKENYPVVKKTVPTFYFIGVTTGKSSIMKVFPLWMKVLGREDVVMEGVDCKIHDEPEVYRKAVAQIKYDPQSLGALVTTHKIDLLTAARDMFDYLDPYALITDEVSSISKLDGRLEGHAKDPLTSGASLDAIIEKGYFAKTHGDVLSFGAGGSAIATLLHLINKKDKGDRPKKSNISKILIRWSTIRSWRVSLHTVLSSMPPGWEKTPPVHPYRGKANSR
jgi:shikimate dehydrogenase